MNVKIVLILTHAFLKRYAKERASYEKEIAQQSKKIEKMLEAKADDHDIQQQKAVLAESQAMIPEMNKLYAKAVADLTKFLKESGDSPELAESPCLKDAQSIVKESSA